MRVRYREAIGSTKSRLLDLVRWAQPALEQALPPLGTTVSLALLENYFDPRRLRRLGVRRLANFLRRHLAGIHRARADFADELARRLVEAAAETLALYGHGGLDFERLQLEVRQEVRVLRVHREHVRELDQEIEKLYERLHPEDLLRSVPGIGSALAPSLLGVHHTWRRFRGGRRMRGFCGLFPKRSESGGVAQPGQRITQGGNNRVKRDLILAAQVARTIDPALAQVYYRCMVEKGTTTGRPCAPLRPGSLTGSARYGGRAGPTSCATWMERRLPSQR